MLMMLTQRHQHYLYHSARVPNLCETMSHCPIDDNEISQCTIAHLAYALLPQSNLRPYPFL